MYFAHCMLYTTDHFASFVDKYGIEVKEFCKSRSGASVPCITLGEGEISVILTARHHACENPGSYTLEGIVEQLLKEPIPNTRVLIVPFMDYDGVVAGDQGKFRQPHDYNRDYVDGSIYPEVIALKEYVEKYGCHYGFDFHAPGNKRNEFDYVYFMNNFKVAAISEMASMLESNNTHDGVQYYKRWNCPASSYDTNRERPHFHGYMNYRPENVLATTVEITYAGTPQNKISQNGLRLFGNGFGTTLKQFIEKNQFTAPTDNTNISDGLTIEATEYAVSNDVQSNEPINITVTGATGGATVGLYFEQADGSYRIYGRIVLDTLEKGQSASVELRSASYLRSHSVAPQPAPALPLDETVFPNGRGIKLVWRSGNALMESLWCPVTHGNYTVDLKLNPKRV